MRSVKTLARSPLGQRRDYTHQFNTSIGRHGWLRLTPAYSVKVVEEIFGTYRSDLNVFDPFCGTGTTALSASYWGHTATTTDINPFLTWLTQVKTCKYGSRTLQETRQLAEKVNVLVSRGQIESVEPPPISNIERWWSKRNLDYLCTLKASIEEISEAGSAERNLLTIAFCRTLITCSNAAFNHQSMSFKQREDSEFQFEQDEVSNSFIKEVEFILLGASKNPKCDVKVIESDARDLRDVKDQFDLVVTSPPYANRMSYVRELRPYMYWLGYLKLPRDAGEMDWSAIGGTWGIATSRLLTHSVDNPCFQDGRLDEFRSKITQPGNKNGHLLANYVVKYFDDMWQHLNALTRVLKASSAVHYIVGNSTFYGTLLQVEQFYAEMLDRIGFTDIECRAIRKRNSKKELFEFDVSARW